MKRRLLISIVITILCGFLVAPAAYAAPRVHGLPELFSHTREERYLAWLYDYGYKPPAYTLGTQALPFSVMDYLSYQWQPDLIGEKKIAKREEGLDMKGVLPELTSAFGAAEALNAQINKAMLAKVAAAKEIKARSITFDYAIYETDSLVSLILLSTVVSASSKTEVASVNFDPVSGALVSLSEAVGVNVKPLAEKLIAEKIRRNPEKYNTSFTYTLPDQQAYYLEDDKLVLLFNEFLLRPGAEGITPLEMDLMQINAVTVTKEDYQVKPGYDLKMVPLRMICEGLGYEGVWLPEESRIEILRDNVFIMEMEPGANNYLVRDKKVRSLEAPPELDIGVVYVPISFFDQILSLVTYSVDQHESITFLSYAEPE